MLLQQESPEQMRGRMAGLARRLKRNPDDPRLLQELETLRAAYKGRQLETRILRAVESAPPLTAEQRSRLAILLCSGAA